MLLMEIWSLKSFIILTLTTSVASLIAATLRTPNKALDRSGDSLFLNLFGVAKVEWFLAARSTSMKPGRVKRKNREDWFTLLFEVTRVRPTWVSQVIRGLI